jgi:hypothetical protein
MTTNEIAEAVQKHAVINYENGGWDYLVECHTRESIVEWIESEGWTTEDQVINGIGKIMRILDSRRREVQAEIF